MMDNVWQIPSFEMTDEEKKQALNMGLLATGAGILAGNRGNYGQAGPAIGHGLLSGMQMYQGINQQMKNDKRQVFEDQYKLRKIQEEDDQRKAKEAAIDSLPPEMQNWARAGAPLGELWKTANPKLANADHGLVPQIGRHPESGKLRYFVQDKGGNSKWLDIEVPENYQIIPGDEYRPTTAIDKRNPFQSKVVPSAGYQPSAQVPSGVQAAPVSAPSAPFSASPSASVPAIIDPRAPWRSLPPKQADDMRQKVYETSRKRLDAMDEEVAKAEAMRRDLERFNQLNTEQGTGGILDRISYVPTFDEQKREMEAIAARLAPNMRVPGSGTTSDRDLALYLQSLPGIDKPGPVNKNISEGFFKQFDAGKRKRAVYENYFQQHGHLDGAEEAFQQAEAAIKPGNNKPAPAGRQVVRTGTLNGRKVVQYSDGTTEYAQ